MNIRWDYPPPREGWRGALDRFIGPGATSTEIALQIFPPLLAAIAAPAYALHRGLGWNGFQMALAAWLAFDMTGGVLTNATSAAKRWYHRKGQSAAQHFGFVAAHLVYLILTAWLFRGLDWGYFAVTGIYLLVAAAFILASPLYLRRPIAYLFYIGALLLSLYGVSPTEGMEWFLPLFYLKLLVSYPVQEEPYRPANES